MLTSDRLWGFASHPRLVGLMILGTLVSSSVMAEEKPGPDGNRGNLSRVLHNPAVQRELGLSEKQIVSAQAASLAVLEKHREDFVTALESDDKRDEIRKVFLAVTNETFDALESILTPAQLARLKQIELQFFGARAFARPNVEQELCLTAEQKKAFDEVGNRFGLQMRSIATDSALSSEEKAKKRSATSKQLAEEVNELLTAEQQAAWEKLRGPLFHP